MNVFVYGSLKSGYWNNMLLQKPEVTFIGNGTIAGFSLYHVASFPGMVKSKDNNEIVHGEIYSVTPLVLGTLDNLEREGFLYKRITTKASVNKKDVDVNTYVYLHEYDNSPKVDDNDWKGYPYAKRKIF